MRDESYSPYANERAQRAADIEAEERRNAPKYNPWEADREKALAAEREEIAKNAQKKTEDFIADRLAYERSRAVTIIVQEKRKEYENKSWFGKAVATLSGRNFDRRKKQITEDAKKSVEGWSEEKVENFIDDYDLHGGKHR